MADLTTLAAVRAALWPAGPAFVADDPWLTRVIASASGFIRAYTNRDLDVPPAAKSDTWDGHGGAALPLRQYPVTGITSVTVDGQAIPQRTSQPGSGWVQSGSLVRLDGYTFTRGAANVVVAYNAGFATLPAELEQACIDLVVWAYKAKDRIGHLTKGVGPEQIAFKVQDMPDLTRTYLNQLRRVAPT